jgi:hypothetical protein
MTPPPTQAWAIKAPQGEWIDKPRCSVSPYCIRADRQASIEAFCGDTANWKHWYRKGYRCVRVEIREMSEG